MLNNYVTQRHPYFSFLSSTLSEKVFNILNRFLFQIRTHNIIFFFYSVFFFRVYKYRFLNKMSTFTLTQIAGYWGPQLDSRTLATTPRMGQFGLFCFSYFFLTIQLSQMIYDQWLSHFCHHFGQFNSPPPLPHKLTRNASSLVGAVHLSFFKCVFHSC